MFSSRSAIILLCLCLQCNGFMHKEKMKEKKPLHCKVCDYEIYSEWFFLIAYVIISPPHSPIIKHKPLPEPPFPPPWWRNMWYIEETIGFGVKVSFVTRPLSL